MRYLRVAKRNFNEIASARYLALAPIIQNKEISRVKERYNITSSVGERPHVWTSKIK